jgi:ribonuclease-3
VSALQELQKKLHYDFGRIELLEHALTHSSCANEMGNGASHNERLEFLGDAALELSVSQELYARFPDVREGELTRMRAKLVSQSSLAVIAVETGVNLHLRLGKGEEAQGGRERPSLLCDAFEAVLGAVFLDGGYSAASAVVSALFEKKWPCVDSDERSRDCKSLLQELTQRRYKERPVYTLVESHGPEHAKVFTVKAALPDGRMFFDNGPSLKRAEQLVAGKALQCLLAEAPVRALDA